MSLSPADLLKVMEEHVPFNRLLGIKGESAEPGRAVLVLPVRPDFVGDFRRPALHGGVLSTVIDTAGGMAAWSALAPGETVSTVDLRVDYLEPAGLAGSFGVPDEAVVLSAQRTRDLTAEYARTAEGGGLEVIMGGGGGAAHLAGVVAAYTVLPVLGVPVESHALKGLDSLLSMVQMPGGVPVGTLAIGKAGAKNAALLAVAILASQRPALREALHRFRAEQARKVRESSLT